MRREGVLGRDRNSVVSFCNDGSHRGTVLGLWEEWDMGSVYGLLKTKSWKIKREQKGLNVYILYSIVEWEQYIFSYL